MTKLEMAHEYALRMIINGSRWGDSNVDSQLKNISINAWKLADAMQAEAGKRSDTERPAVLKDEWQPDWSAAPEWANWWAMDGFSKKANWYIDKPYLDDDSEVESEWNIDLKTNTETYMCAPSFGYQGSWENSLRKRP